MSKYERWAIIVILAAMIGIKTAEMIVFMPDWLQDLSWWWK